MGAKNISFSESSVSGGKNVSFSEKFTYVLNETSLKTSENFQKNHSFYKGIVRTLSKISFLRKIVKRYRSLSATVEQQQLNNSVDVLRFFHYVLKMSKNFFG